MLEKHPENRHDPGRSHHGLSAHSKTGWRAASLGARGTLTLPKVTD